MAESFEAGARVVVVSGPAGFDPAAALFSAGVHLRGEDRLVSVERPGNILVEVVEPDERKRF